MYSVRAKLTICLAALVCTVAVAEDEGFTSLFDGKTLDGWRGDTNLWCVEDGCIAGSTEGNPIKSNTFLATTKSYRNFVLKARFKLRNHNSGIQIRSKEHAAFRVTGYQADIAQSRYTGILYEEGGRGILANVDPKKVDPVVKKGDWNDYLITCDGPKITLQINGFTTVEYVEKSEKGATQGVIALQLHAGPAMKVWFKDIAIRELP